MSSAERYSIAIITLEEHMFREGRSQAAEIEGDVKPLV